MNYYEHHLGDYAEATAHLTFIEDAAYSRLIRKYYATERPIPADLKQAQRLIGARTKEEKEAVKDVLQEFFFLEEDGWRNERCDEEIASYVEKKPELQAKKENDKERQRRARERRKALFHALREAGQVPSYDATTTELEAMLSRVTGFEMSQEVTHQVTRDNTANQTPDPRPQTPDPSLNTNQAALDLAFPAEKPDSEGAPISSKTKLPDCPHLDVLQLWSEVLPALPQHNPDMWRGTRADHLRARWRETAASKQWTAQADGLAYFRKLFAFVGKSPFLTGQTRSSDPSKRPFTVELEWLVNPSNWAKVHEGKYHTEA